MKRFSLFLVAFLVFVCGLSTFSFAENEIINEVVVEQKISPFEKVVEIMDKVTVVALPICILLVAVGAVQFFIMGIRNLYKKKQGLLLMFGSMTFYVVLLIVSFALTVISVKDLSQPIDVSNVVENVEETADNALNGVMEVAVNTLSYIAEWSLPFCAILIVFGAVQYFIMGIRNLYKKRQGLLLMFGSGAFFAIIIILNFIMQIIFKSSIV